MKPPSPPALPRQRRKDYSRRLLRHPSGPDGALRQRAEPRREGHAQPRRRQGAAPMRTAVTAAASATEDGPPPPLPPLGSDDEDDDAPSKRPKDSSERCA